MTPEQAIRGRAAELGFDLCRFTTAEPPASRGHFDEWLQRSYHGEMGWLERTAARRRNLQEALPGAASVVAVAAAYGCEGSAPPPAAERAACVAAYARHTDYHEVFAPRLERLARFVDEQAGPPNRSLWHTDSGPVLERDLAQRSGIGFIGKHTNLIGRAHGNWLLLGEILTTARLVPDSPEKNRCGTCSRCIQACPTGAIVAPFTLDARRCISYLTIELKGPIPLPLRPLIGNRVFGCDDCLAVCPWNRFSQQGALMLDHVRADLTAPRLAQWLELDAAGFNARFRGTPLMRAKRRGLLRNVCVVLGNVGSADNLPALHRAATDPEPLIAEHAQWAIEQIQARTRGGA